MDHIGRSPCRKSFVFAPNTGDIRFQDNPGYGFVELSTLPLSLTGADWYYMEVTVDSTSEATGALWDSAGSLEGVLTENYGSGLGDGWLALRSFGGGVFDDVLVSLDHGTCVAMCQDRRDACFAAGGSSCSADYDTCIDACFIP